jgi:hypothetical protein
MAELMLWSWARAWSASASPCICSSGGGHQHHGPTLGPATGRLLAEMMTGQAPFTDPAPYAVERFG